MGEGIEDVGGLVRQSRNKRILLGGCSCEE
jgi:hypothetical protein